MGNHRLHLLIEGKGGIDDRGAMGEPWTNNVDQERNEPIPLGLDEPSHDRFLLQCPNGPPRSRQPAL